jgi:DNA-binding CsgD family transcriptional regulator
MLKCGRLEEVQAVATRSMEIVRRHGRGESFLASLLASIAVEALLSLGRTAEAALWLESDTAGPVHRERWPLHLHRAHLDLLRGHVTAARERIMQIHALPIGGNPGFTREIAQIACEIDLWDGRPDGALDEARRALAAIEGTDEVMHAGWLLVTALRASADIAVRARARRDDRALHHALTTQDELHTWRQRQTSDPFAAHPYLPARTAQAASWHAEHTRAAGHDDPDAWCTAAGAWQALRRPHRAGYALWRQGEALLGRDTTSKGQVTAVLRTASRLADGAEPLATAVRALGRRARIDLVHTDDANPEHQAEPPDSYRLTEREKDILSLIAQGRTNAEIGAVLFISPKTVSVHITNLLRKLGVTNRVQAATLAERAGLTTPTQN